MVTNQKKRLKLTTKKVRSRAVVYSSITKSPHELRFAVVAGQTAGVRVPIGDAIDRRMKGDFVHLAVPNSLASQAIC